jgi:uncharacterized membrane protein (UPF0127 family)
MGKFLTLTLAFLLLACQSVSRNPLKEVTLVSPHGDEIKTTVVWSAEDQIRGLSGTRPKDFSDDQGMLFFYLNEDEKHFWMPDTYFDLDIIYLDKDLKILDIVRKVPHYIGRVNEHLIPRVRPVWSRHALEMKATSAIAQKLKIGDQLKWESTLDLKQTEAKIRIELDSK